MRGIVLLVETDEELAKEVQCALSEAGFAVIRVADPGRALAYLDRELAFEASDALPDVLVAGVPLEGPSHTACLALIRAVGRRIPVVVVAEPEDREAMALVGPEGAAALLERPSRDEEVDAVFLRRGSGRETTWLS
jgi:DNA-binding response OmpR family regulator